MYILKILKQLQPKHVNRELKIIVVHGETITEPVMPGTNKKALMSDIDILAHPGLISDDEAELAAEKGIYLEITARKGHSITNGHVAALDKKTRG